MLCWRELISVATDWGEGKDMIIRAMLSSACVLALAGCGGGGNGASTPPVVSGPAPTPTPAPSPAPSPTPTPSVDVQTFVQPGLTAAGTGNALDPQNATAFSVAVSDPDAPAASSYGDINFDGDETIVVRHTGLTIPYDETFTTDSYRGAGGNSFYTGSTAERFVPTRGYQSRVGQSSSAFLVMPLLEEVRKTASAAPRTDNVTDSVRLLDVRVAASGNPPQSRALQLVGARTPQTAVPTAGTSTFVGESFGVKYSSNGNVQDYIGDSVLTIDYDRRTLTGQITIAQFLGSTPVRPTLTIEIIGEVAADGTLTGKLTVRGTGTFEAGYLTGALYGNRADELGFVLYSSGESGSVLGGVVAGQECSLACFVAAAP